MGSLLCYCFLCLWSQCKRWQDEDEILEEGRSCSSEYLHEEDMHELGLEDDDMYDEDADDEEDLD